MQAEHVADPRRGARRGCGGRPWCRVPGGQRSGEDAERDDGEDAGDQGADQERDDVGGEGVPARPCEGRGRRRGAVSARAVVAGGGSSWWVPFPAGCVGLRRAYGRDGEHAVVTRRAEPGVNCGRNLGTGGRPPAGARRQRSGGGRSPAEDAVALGLRRPSGYVLGHRLGPTPLTEGVGGGAGLPPIRRRRCGAARGSSCRSRCAG